MQLPFEKNTVVEKTVKFFYGLLSIHSFYYLRDKAELNSGFILVHEIQSQ